MAVSIRLRRMGRKKKPHYRVVVAEKTSPRDGRFIESLGYYKPLTIPARLVIDLKRVDYWMSQGALPSQTVRSLIAKARKGGDPTLALGEVDRDAEKAKKAEVLAAKRKAEVLVAKQKAEASAAAVAKKAEASAAAAKEAEEEAEEEAVEEEAVEEEAVEEEAVEEEAVKEEAVKEEAVKEEAVEEEAVEEEAVEEAEEEKEG